jgi:hypothetical protein
LLEAHSSRQKEKNINIKKNTIMKKSFKLAALFIAAAISVAVVSCQKDKETEEPVASQS